MVFFTLKSEEGSWGENKEEFLNDLKKIEDRFKQLDEDILNRNFISQNEEKRTKAEENLKRLLASTSYMNKTIVKIQLYHLSDMDEELNKELELVAKKILIALNAANSIAQEVGRMIWDAQFKEEMLDKPLMKIEKEIKSKLDTLGKDTFKIQQILIDGENKKAEILEKAFNKRNLFAQNYVSNLINIGMNELEQVIRNSIEQQNT